MDFEWQYRIDNMYFNEHIKIKMICVIKGGQMMDSTLPLAW